MDSLLEKIYQNNVDIQLKALQTIAWINQTRSNQDNIVAVKFDKFSKSAESNLTEVQLNALYELQQISQKVQLNAPQNTENNDITGVLFSEKEIQKMPKQFQKYFKTGKIKANIRQRNGIYEIRCQINKQNLSASSKRLYEAKEKFIKKLKELQITPLPNYASEKFLLKDYMLQWLEATKKPYVKDTTYRFYMQAFNANIVPSFGDRDIKDIKQIELQSFINSFEDRKRTATNVSQLLSAIFDYAVADGIIPRSPMAKVRIPTYEQKHGTPLTRAEEKIFVDNLKSNNEDLYLQAYVFILYTGLRRSELSSVKINDTWITVTNGKQRKGKSEKQRRIPISPMLKKVLPLIDVNGITALKTEPLTRHFKLMSANHHLHDLRHTFITRCQECGIQREIVSLWAGHAADSSITSTVYTHLEHYEENQLREIKKFSYIL